MSHRLFLAASALREDSKAARRLRTTSACSRLAPPGARSASIAERTACSEASVSATLAPSGECCGTSSRRAYSVCARSSARRWISDHRAAASAQAARRALRRRSSSSRAEPFAYASTSLDRQPAAAAERRRAERAIDAIRRPGQGRPAEPRARSGWCRRRRRAPRNRSGRRLGGGGRRDAGPGRDGRGPARQAADRAADGAPRAAASNPADKQGHREGKSFHRTPHAESCRVVSGRPLEPPFACGRDRCRACPDGLVAAISDPSWLIPLGVLPRATLTTGTFRLRSISRSRSSTSGRVRCTAAWSSPAQKCRKASTACRSWTPSRSHRERTRR